MAAGVHILLQGSDFKGVHITVGERDRSSDGRRGTAGWLFAAVAVLGVVALVGLVLAHNASTQGQEIQQSLENRVKAVQADFTSPIATLQQHQAQTDTNNSGSQ